jgi:uncharacterized protein YecT (DUF1311 family)
MNHLGLVSRVRTAALAALIILMASVAPASARAASGVLGWSSMYVEPPAGKLCDQDAGTMAKCAGGKMQHSERFLESLISELRTRVDESQVKPFMDANASWFHFRDASCRFDSVLAGGSSQAMRYGECVHAYNVQRIHLLEQYLYCVGGGECPNDMHLYYLLEDTAR